MEVNHNPLFENVDCISFKVDDLDAGIEFYAKNLGLKLLWRSEDSCGLSMKNDITEVVLTTAPENSVVQFKVEKVEDAVEKFIKAGGTLIYGPFDIKIGRCAVVKDKWENEFCLLDMTKGRLKVDEEFNVIGIESLRILAEQKSEPRSLNKG